MWIHIYMCLVHIIVKFFIIKIYIIYTNNKNDEFLKCKKKLNFTKKI